MINPQYPKGTSDPMLNWFPKLAVLSKNGNRIPQKGGTEKLGLYKTEILYYQEWTVLRKQS